MSAPVPSSARAGADRWLASRLEAVPPRLAESVRDLSVGDGPDGLAEAALAAFERVAAGGSRRAGALELLAADALLTYAFEAAADPARGGSAVAALELADRVGAEIRSRLVAS